MESEQRIPWFILTGMVLGFFLGWGLSFIISQPVNNQLKPSELSSVSKSIYQAAIAEAFYYNQDLKRASSRLELLSEPDIVENLTKQAQLMLNDDAFPHQANALANLVKALQNNLPDH